MSILCYLIKWFWIETSCNFLFPLLLAQRSYDCTFQPFFCHVGCLFPKSSFPKIHVVSKVSLRSKIQEICSILATFKVLSLNFHYKTKIWQWIFQGFWLRNWGFHLSDGLSKTISLTTVTNQMSWKWLLTFLCIGESLKFLSYFSIVVKLWCMRKVMNNLAFLKKLHYLLNLPVTKPPIIAVEKFWS